ncbi:MAG: glycosyltransferase [Faecalicatena sp.]|uniref:glycosyltransferase n=1 Tax=Faecalicatena sp. TaxID=2005360 RepID=UPI0025851465|nr:glycosyltransferase [Faecalicatena sp.]MCI6465882.1 glycosyltransferase [Faecalicatena sp.]MDY5618702.1 glycosyltransferase [Lachnospiraceae bacterium]
MAQISIVIPVYRVEKTFLKKCIESLLNQTLKDLEVIIVDDGTTDECKEFCRAFAERDHRILYLVQPNSGVSVARNNGIAHASAPLITFVDADDWVEPQMCEILVREFENQEEIQICVFAAYLDGQKGEKKNPFWNCQRKIFTGKEKEQLQLQSIYRKAAQFIPEFATFGTTWCKCYRRQWLIQSKLQYEPELRRGQDTIFNLHAFENAEQILYINEYLYHYRLNDASAVHRYTDGVIVYLNRILKHILNFIRTYEKPDYFYQAYYSKCASLLVTAMENDCFHEDNPKTRKEKRQDLKKMISDEIYVDAFAKIDMNRVPFQTKVFWTLIRIKAVRSLFIVNRLYKMLKK